MNPIFNALSGGYSANQILNFIQSFIPKLSTKINAAKKQGYSSEKIVEFLSDTMQSEANSIYQTSNRIHAKNREENKKLTKDLLKQGVNLGATAIGASVLSKMVPNLGKMINHRGNVIPTNNPAQSPTFPNNPVNPQNTSNPIPIQNQPIPQPASPNQNPGQPGPNVGQKIGQQAASPVFQAIKTKGNVPIPPQQNQPQQQIDFGQVLDQIGIKNRVDAMRERNPPDIISKAISYGMPKNQIQELEKQLGVPLDQVIEGYISNAPAPETMQEKIAKGVPLRNRQEDAQNTPIETQENKNKQPIEDLRIKNIPEKDLYHQTTSQSAEKIKSEGFQLRKGAKKDIELPHGVYMKPDNLKIELPGNEQLSVKARLGKTATFKNRDEYKKYLFENSEEYKKIYNEYKRTEKEQLNVLYELDKNINNYSDDKIEELDEKIKDYDEKINKLVEEGREVATQYFLSKGIDSLHVEKDVGGPSGKPVETYISLNPERVKLIGSSVLLPDGNIGQIQDIKQGIAKVNVDGKNRHKKVDELIESPLPEKDLADLYQDVLSGIEKKSGQQVSRNVFWAGYDPRTNELAFIPHQGALYVYKDISPEDAKDLTSFLTQRKTTGENYIGAWESGSKSPIGAAMSLLIQRLQKQAGGKGKEYSGKYEKIYDALELAKLELKKKKDEERKKRKA